MDKKIKKLTENKKYIILYALFIIPILLLYLNNLSLIIHSTILIKILFITLPVILAAILILQIIFQKNAGLFLLLTIFNISFFFVFLIIFLIITTGFRFHDIFTILIFISLTLSFIIKMKNKYKIIINAFIISLYFIYTILSSINYKNLTVSIFQENFNYKIIKFFFILLYFLMLYLVIEANKKKINDLYTNILTKKNYKIDKLKLKIKNYKLNFKSWKNIDVGILNNINKLSEIKNELLSSTSGINKINTNKIKKFSTNYDKHIKLLYSFINRAEYIIEKNSDNLLLTVEASDFLMLVCENFESILNLKVKKFPYQITVNVDNLYNFLNQLLNHIIDIKNKNNPISRKNQTIFTYFNKPQKENTHYYTLNLNLKNQNSLYDKIKKLAENNENIIELLEKYKYKIKIDKYYSPDLIISIKIPKIYKQVKENFNTNYIIKLSGKNNMHGIMEVTQDDTKYPIELTKTEYRLVHILMKKLKEDLLGENKNKSLSGYIDKFTVVKEVFGDLHKHGNRLSTHLYRLRTKLKNYGLNPDLFQSKDKSLRISTSANVNDIII